ALAGARVDGHDHVLGAWRDGAVAALTGRDVPPAPCLPVADPLVALGRLARHVVDRAVAGGAQVVGITGSQGKTSTKDLLAQVLEPAGPTVAPVGNLNNELGVPLTACRLEPGSRFLVGELGARGIGHIAYLCGIVAPRVGVVLNVGHAHVGEFGGQQAIARAKGELVEALPAAGVAVLNADDPAVAAMATRTRARVATVGRLPEAQVRADDVALDAGRARFRLVTPRGSADVALRLVGAHHVGNALSAAAVALECGATPEGVASTLSAAGPASRWRMEVVDRPDGVTVVNDAYNANPESMRAALQALVAIAAGPPGRRTWAVLGRMGELGDTAPAAHAEVAAAAAELEVDSLVAVDAPEYAGARQVADVAEALGLLRAELEPGDVVLIKASRAAGLDRLAEALVAASDTGEREPVA
ncbi:MAG TPA: UDP-N-acetylmuramoyl-tripeptide--D-alanyl-D-alanine ligase, partial [Pseudonocardia sp.]|nr:UDP-N-acetylmuramoyl-tripeptide--D-alanyl-D-alanine ligase [Pseudonocardia sp.]